MSSHNFETCLKCNTNAPLISCKLCQIRICNGCFDKHANICELITKHVGISSNLCKVHNGETVVSFCFVCSELLCCSCQPDHENHIKDVYSLKDAVDRLKINIPVKKNAYEKKLSEAETYIQEIPAKYRKIDEMKRRSESTVNNTMILSFAKYKPYIEQKCDKMDRLKILLTAAIENLPWLVFLSNPYVFLPVWVGVVSDVDNFGDELDTDSDDEFDFAELVDYTLNIEEEKTTIFENVSKFCSDVSKLTSKKIPAGLSFIELIDFTLEGVKRKLDDYKTEVHFLQPKIAELEKLKREQKKRSKYELDEKNTLAAEVENLKKSKHDLQKKLKRNQKTNHELKNREQNLQGKCKENEETIKKLQKSLEKQRSEVQRESHVESMEKQTTINEDVIDNIDTRIVDIEQLQQSKIELEKELQIQRENARASNEELKILQSKIELLEVAQNNLKEENGKLEERVKGCQKELRKFMTDIEEMEKEITDLKKKIQEKEAEKNYAQTLVAETQKTLSRYTSDNKKKNKAIESLETKIQHFEAELYNAKEREKEFKGKLHLVQNELEKRHKQATERELKIESLKSEKDDLQTRLSSFAGDKLTRGNPAITDLADPNRPMKVGERYGELYDNDWTDAMEKVELIKKYFPDESTSEVEEILIKYLLRIVRCCYHGCLRKANKQVEQIASIIGIGACAKPIEGKVGADELMGCDLITLRQRYAMQFAKQLVDEKAFCDTLLDEWNFSFKNHEVMTVLISSSFYEKCVELCWYMVIQDPIMCLDEDIPSGTLIDKNTYREFTKSGEKLVYIVWPALYLHKDGPLLYKGVAQVK